MNGREIRPWNGAGYELLFMIGWQFPGMRRGSPRFEPRTVVTAVAEACI